MFFQAINRMITIKRLGIDANEWLRHWICMCTWKCMEESQGKSYASKETQCS